MKPSMLELRWRTRSGAGSRTERRYLDFIIDGASLQDCFEPRDQVTGLGCWAANFEEMHIHQLLAEAPAESPTGRVPIYVCGECGDLGCGAITAFVERTPDGFLWRDFAYENDYDPEMTEIEAYREIGPFLFGTAEYRRALAERPVA
jgi:hypothetical protein